MKKVKLELAVMIVMLYEIKGEVGELTWKWFVAEVEKSER
jgi:hypothetical protein